MEAASADFLIDATTIEFQGVTLGKKVICTRGRSHPSYDVTLVSGSNPTRSVVTLSFRNAMFNDLHLKISGDLRVEASFPGQMSKWQRYVTLKEEDLVHRASMLDVWMREVFSLRRNWPPSVAPWVNQFLGSALLASTSLPPALEGSSQQARSSKQSPPPPPPPPPHDADPVEHEDAIFISLRFGEAMAEAQQLREALAARGESAFICEVPPGEDIKSVVIDKLAKARLVVVLGTKTYGAGTVNFSTREEMEFFLSEKTPFFLVKMCDAFEEPRTRFNFGPSVSYIQWFPGDPMPDGLVAAVLTATEQACRSTEAPSEQRVAVRKRSLQRRSQIASASATAAAGAAAANTATPTTKKSAAFLSHYKMQAGTEARLVHGKLKEILGEDAEVFLDSDDLQDLRLLLEHVRSSDVLVLLQTRSVLERPWVILELYTAITHGVPIVALNVANAFPYNYGAALDFLTHFDLEIDIANPGAANLLVEHGVDPVDVAHCLSTVLPSIISTDFNPSGSSNAINAAMLDLQAAMARAAPYPLTVGKEDWLAKRGSVPRSARRQSKLHGGGALAAPVLALAEIPPTVPELPNAYLVRESDIAALKAALLTQGGPSSAALTSANRKASDAMNSNSATTAASAACASKVGAHGMGGVGKTTIAAALVHEEAILAAFETVVWVSVGQEPDIREVQDSIHYQLTEKGLPESTFMDERNIVTALRAAAKPRRALLVLDDVWDPKHEKALNCLNAGNGSRLLVTTRIRGLLSRSCEVSVGVLGKDEALQLLLSSANLTDNDVVVDDDDDDDDDYGAAPAAGSRSEAIALEIVELCGRLPLTLAIAGGMISDHPDGLTEDIVEVMKEDRLRGEEEADGGMTLEERIISSGLKMVEGRHRELAVKVFNFFAVFPEDIAVPGGLFRVLTPLLLSNEKNEKKARLAVGSSLSTLLKYNLIKGSLSGGGEGGGGSGSGVFMHDIVRDYVIHQHSSGRLRSLQRRVVGAVLAARPEPDGFPTSECSSPATFEGYVARQLWWHCRGALHYDDNTKEPPPEAWLTHRDNVVRSNVAAAVGLEALAALSEAREAAGDVVGAAHVSFTASKLKGMDLGHSTALAYRATDLLERADDAAAADFEARALSWVIFKDMGSERNRRAKARSKKLKSEGSFSGKMTEGMQAYDDIMVRAGCMGEDKDDIHGALDSALETGRLWVEASGLTDHPFLRSFWAAMAYPFSLSLIMTYTHLEKWDPDKVGCTEESMVRIIDAYQFSECGVTMKNSGVEFDSFRTGSWLPMVALWHGNLDAFDVWHRKVVGVFHEMKLSSNDRYTEEWVEVGGAWNFAGCPLYLVLGQAEKSRSLLESIGFTWSADGSQNFDKWFRAFQVALPSDTHGADMRGAFTAEFRIALILSDLAAHVEEEANAWMPSPAALADLERKVKWIPRFGTNDIVSFGARAFLKLGRDDDAYELCTIAVSPEQGTQKKTALVTCHSILGRVAASRGAFDEADGHFASALKEAQWSRLPMLEVLAARDWRACLLLREGSEKTRGDVERADAVIDSACQKMRKSRGDIACVLASTIEGKRMRRKGQQAASRQRYEATGRV